jgi:hypothetical protein
MVAASKELNVFGDFNSVGFCLEVYEITVRKALTDGRTFNADSGLPLMDFNINTPGPEGDDHIVSVETILMKRLKTHLQNEVKKFEACIAETLKISSPVV